MFYAVLNYFLIKDLLLIAIKIIFIIIFSVVAFVLMDFKRGQSLVGAIQMEHRKVSLNAIPTVNHHTCESVRMTTVQRTFQAEKLFGLAVLGVRYVKFLDAESFSLCF